MNLQEIINENKYYQSGKESLELQLKNMKSIIQSINNTINFDDIKLLPYSEVKSIHKLIYWNITDIQRKELDDILKLSKQSEYPQLTKAHYYPVINEMDFLPDDRKKELDELLKRLYNSYIHIHSGAWYKLNFKEEITQKVLEFLHDKGIIEKSYIIRCGCGSSEDCDPEYISQERYDRFVNYHNKTNEEKEACGWGIDGDGYIEVGCWNDGYKEIYDLDTFLKTIQVDSYKNVTKPDTSLDEV